MNDLKIRQLSLFFVAFLPVTKIFLLPSVLASISKNDMWISISLSLIIDFLTLIAIIFIFKKFPEKSFYEILVDSFGKVASKIILSFYALIFLIKAYFPIVEQRNFIELTLYETKPTIFTFLPFFIVSFYLSIKNKVAIGRMADVLSFMTFFSFILLFSLSFANSDLTMILPLGVSGIKNILLGSYTSFPWLNDSVYLLFLIGGIKYKKGALWKICLGFIIGSLLVIVFNIIFYGAFSSIAERQEFALTEISKYSAVISIVGRFDYVAIFIILFSNVIALSLPLFFATECLQTVCNFKYKFISSLIVNGIMLILIFSLNVYILSIQNIVERYLSGIFIFFFNILPCFILILKKGEKNEKLQTIQR